MGGVTVIERNGRETRGTLLYAYDYPHAVYDETGRIERFEQRPQRVGVLASSGVSTHFTVPLQVRRG